MPFLVGWFCLGLNPIYAIFWFWQLLGTAFIGISLQIVWVNKISERANTAQHGVQRTGTIVLDGTFPCPECHFTEKHLASCSRR